MFTIYPIIHKSNVYKMSLLDYKYQPLSKHEDSLYA